VIHRSQAVETLRSNVRFKQVLSVVLMAGNYLNGGTARGQAGVCFGRLCFMDRALLCFEAGAIAK
jgi:hypothetical protein